MKFFPLVLSLFVFILISNLIGIIPYIYMVSLVDTVSSNRVASSFNRRGQARSDDLAQISQPDGDQSRVKPNVRF